MPISNTHKRLHTMSAALDHAGSITDAQHGVRTLANAHAHGNLSGVTANQHHARQHVISAAADHSGRIALSQMTLGGAGLVLTGQGAGDPTYAAVGGATKQFFVPCFSGTGGYLSADYMTGYAIDGVNEFALMSFYLPADFTSLTSIKVLLCNMGAAGTIDWTASTIYGASGESYNNHTGSKTADGQAATSLKYLPIDISTAFASIAAGDTITAKFKLDAVTGTPTIYVIGLDVKYA